MDATGLTIFKSEESSEEELDCLEWLCKLETLEFHRQKEITQTMEETFDCPFVVSPMAIELNSYQLPPLPNSNLEYQDFDDFDWFDQCFPSNSDSSGMINANEPQPPPIQQMISNHSIRDGSSEKLTDRESVGSSCSRTANQDGKRKCSIRPKSIEIDLDEIKKHFNVPITKAAREMRVGLTVLKKRCRELNINRWPHRKIKSLASLIENVKELGLTGEVEKLEEHIRLMEKLPEIELTEETKKLRQTCFKAKYKSRRSLAAALS
ncbi:hypothetical protein NE237_012286 [Protea cynaroides]|uniref:RWP-RK domain-containing protein n=1 Tax=Protea cynaroides TaxID=273540 RepID=A0A9Q0JZ36_9MAGN|nr:hypothetical protein NE237_012286 [Protea cynaroides]